ncbi:transmembrane protein 246-like [Acanthaster planci]|uniref:Transmembrane protein 246-like n=1 Tax=Acanthaster planci TaxID=133434 RepID=A0A8B7Y7H6_ACAPL|nr:transmembrane protein 246-like [Acanthaster planci]
MLCLTRVFTWTYTSSSTLFVQWKGILVRTAIVYGVTFLLVLPLLCQNLPYSVYFVTPRDVEQKALQLNQYRVSDAEKYLATLAKNGPSKALPKAGSLRIVVGVISVSRKTRTFSTQYLTQVMAGLHKIIARHGVEDEVFTFICTTQKAGRSHPEADRLAGYFHVVRFPLDRPRHDGWRHEEEKEGYTFCLESAARFDAKYVLLLQDDALPRANFYEVLDHLLRHRLERAFAHGRAVVGPDDWAWLKLNFPNELANFHRSPFFVGDWVALSLVLASLVTITFHFCSGQLSSSPIANHALDQKSRRRGHLATSYCIFLVSFAYFFLASWLIGRPYFLHLYGLSKHFARLDPGTSCCLPAVLFPRERVAGLVKYLDGVTCKPGFPLDFALEAFREQESLRQYLVVPNLFTHIGYYSALHTGTNRQSAYAFLEEFSYLPP